MMNLISLGRLKIFLLVLGTTILVSGCDRGNAQEFADIVIRGGKIATVNPEMPEVEALAARGDKIFALGSANDIAELIGPDTQIIELDGRLAIPGLIEGHGHFMSMGNAKLILDLTVAKSWEEIVEMVEEAVAAAEPGEWITGRGWHQDKWESVPQGSVEGVPTHQSLSEASPDNPVLLRHASGHASFANEEALKLGAVSNETPNPSGGEIVRDSRGYPTGMLRETASGLVSRARSQARQNMTEEELAAEREIMARLAAQESLENGITSFQDAGSSFATIDFFKEQIDAGNLPIRLYVMISGSNDDLAERLPEYRIDGYGDNRLTVRSIKRGIDGALGTHGAWLLAPYEDLPSSAGLNTASIESVTETARLAALHGFQLNVHAIGDRANREVLDMFESAYKLLPENADPRWRIEHSQHVDPADLPRFAELGVIPSMQANHATSDALWVFRRLGEKRAEEGAYKWQTLWQSGAIVTNGTDVPVEKINPLASFYASVGRIASDGSVFYADERLSREQALQSYTINNAIAAFEEDIKGSLEIGKLADITILSQDILTIELERIMDTKIDMTIVGGEVLYEREREEDE